MLLSVFPEHTIRIPVTDLFGFFYGDPFQFGDAAQNGEDGLRSVSYLLPGAFAESAVERGKHIGCVGFGEKRGQRQTPYRFGQTV